MLLIIQLQGLALSANAKDIRIFFDDLYIPPGGVRIIGGEKSTAFIKFITDEEARRAMLLNNTILHGAPVQLFLSSEMELQNAIEQKKACDVSATVSAPTAVVQFASHSTTSQQIELEPMTSLGISLAHITSPCASQQPQKNSSSNIPTENIATSSLLNDAISSCSQPATTSISAPEQVSTTSSPAKIQQPFESAYAIRDMSQNTQIMDHTYQGHGYAHSITTPCAAQQPQQYSCSNIPTGIIATNSLLNDAITSYSQHANTYICAPIQAFYTRSPVQSQESVQSGYAVTGMLQNTQIMTHTYQDYGYEGPAKQAELVQKSQIDPNFPTTINKSRDMSMYAMLSSKNETYGSYKTCGTVNQIKVDCHNPVYFSAIMTTRDKHVQPNVFCGYPGSIKKRSLSPNVIDEDSRPLKKLNIGNACNRLMAPDSKPFGVKNLDIAEAKPMPDTNALFHSNSSNAFSFQSAFGAQMPPSDEQPQYLKGNVSAQWGRSGLWNQCGYRAPSVYNDSRKYFQNVNDMRGLNTHFSGTQDWHNMRAYRDVIGPTDQCVPQNYGVRHEHPNLQNNRNQRTFAKPQYRR